MSSAKPREIRAMIESIDVADVHSFDPSNIEEHVTIPKKVLKRLFFYKKLYEPET